ncbi:MAG: GNAT family N-acetyltransferase [Lysobacter sp.]|nr:GNAT family N-acetyltransferase [Lysobacter sp.]
MTQLNPIEIRPATPADRVPIGRMLELYQHDLSDVWDQDLDGDGQYGYSLDKYWSNPRCRAFVFLVAGKYAGFALVDDSVSLPENEHWMAQFFVIRKYRRQGLGSEAARRVFDVVRGRWEVGQMRKNLPAQAFWRRVIDEYTGGRFVEHELADESWDGLLQCFDNSPRAA